MSDGRGILFRDDGGSGGSRLPRHGCGVRRHRGHGCRRRRRAGSGSGSSSARRGSTCFSSPRATVPPSRAAVSSAFLFITMMEMRRLIGLFGFCWSISTADDRPTTRTILLSSMPPAISSRRDALARSADSSQLL